MSRRPAVADLMELIQSHIPQARLVGNGQAVLTRVHTDTRTLQAGDLFVALKGERFDANQFLAQAREAGAAAALAHGGLEAAGLSGIEVPDSLAALGALATAWRARFALPLMLYVTFLQVPVAELRRAFGQVRFLAALMTANFIVVPLRVAAERKHP